MQECMKQAAAVNPRPGGKARIEMKQYLKPGDLTG